jgi:organic hydroperoxide reductase OsmC/OhrA
MKLTLKPNLKPKKIEIEDLQKQLAEAKEKCAVAEAKRGISE